MLVTGLFVGVVTLVTACHQRTPNEEPSGSPVPRPLAPEAGEFGISFRGQFSVQGVRRSRGVTWARGSQGGALHFIGSRSSVSYGFSLPVAGTVELTAAFASEPAARPSSILLQEGVRGLNDDVYPDLILGNYSILGEERIEEENSLLCYGTGARGEFRLRSLTTRGARGISHGDLNRDGIFDVVVSNACGDESSVFLGPLGLGQELRLQTETAQGNAIADLDQDGDLDLIFSCFQDGNEIWSRVYWNDGGEQPFLRTTALPVNACEAISVRDFDQDGVLDLLCSHLSRRLRGSMVLRGQLEGGQWQVDMPGSWLLPIPGTLGAVGFDVDGDGWDDAVFTQPKDSRVAIAYGPPPFADVQFVPLQEDAEPFTVAVADLDEDGLQDLIVSERFAESLALLWGAGERKFELDRSLPARQPKSAAAGDLDGDGWLDLVVHNGGPSGSDPQRAEAFLYYSEQGKRRFDGPYPIAVNASTFGLGTSIVGSNAPAADNAYGDHPTHYNRLHLFVLGDELVLQVHDYWGMEHRLALPRPRDEEWHQVTVKWDAEGLELRIDEALATSTDPLELRRQFEPVLNLGQGRNGGRSFTGAIQKVRIVAQQPVESSP